MKLLLRKLASRYLWRCIYKIKLIYFNFFLDLKKDVIVVLSPGKVGSSSVYKTIKKNNPNAYVFHLHFLFKTSILRGILIHKNSLRKSVPNHFIDSLLLNSVFLKQRNRIKFIILFREPISRYISDSYQNYNRVLKKLNIDNNDKLFDEINNGLSRMDHLNYLENWITNELKINLNYDFYKRSKLFINDYFTDFNEKYDFLFMKMECLNASFKNASKEFLDLEIDLENVNISANKNYNELYKFSKSKIKLTKETTQKMKKFKYIKMIYPIN